MTMKIMHHQFMTISSHSLSFIAKVIMSLLHLFCHCAGISQLTRINRVNGVGLAMI